ncbi:DNA-binding protein RHL1 [Selaginella moellendorffii]|uniref:DNA-binding protein RHL1 n=1 Tax=Selaginella moellendorffii TaxID=88036 RepID=UPI000D1C35D3|nr:DNA-binding protein RHL1 [Selaginella moellendorffii]XP_024530016.1 DNA-binding protein RHL1 [Selaginella moellendorffii]|eukprot:XP_024530015.1 DNA-binding protein RHL1 [Selaginella moellendorffii]
MKHGASENPEQQAIQEESARLRNAAISRGLLGRSAASPPQLLLPSKELLKCDGKDIVKKGTRKSKFLFSFPGLVAPVAGGKFGDLAHLDTKNPILYVDFPKGRIKLFGTIVYPKNKYLTLQLTKGSKSVICDDVIESLVVFSESWWIGTKEENPEEKKLDMPKDLCEEKHTNYSFTAGAGSDSKTTTQAQKLAASVSTCTLKQSTLTGFQSPSLPEEPIRQSVRTSGQKRSYSEIDISDDEIDEADTPKAASTSKSEACPERKAGKKATILDFMVRKPAL